MHTMIQVLEERRLLSASVVDGVLTVTGTEKNDNISISVSPDGETLTVTETAATRFRRAKPTRTTFEAETVTSVVVNGGIGNDTVELRGFRRQPFALPATLNGDEGNDVLKGGAGADALNGGAGDDDLFGGDGADSLAGQEGDDLLRGGAGDDSLDGGAGDDLLDGGLGADSLLGGEGDDLLIAIDGAATDNVDGGPDSALDGEEDQDRAIIDEGDTLANATEKTLRGKARFGLSQGHGRALGHVFSHGFMGFARRH